MTQVQAISDGGSVTVSVPSVPVAVTEGAPRPAIADRSADHVLDFPAAPTRAGLALADLRAGFQQSWLWVRLAHQDMRLRYRGSLLGPFWQTITTAVLISSMGFIYSRLFHVALQDYLPLLSLGLVLWTFLAGLITEGCGTFDAVRGIIQQVKLPLSLHAYRLVYRNFLILAHNFVIVPIVLVLFRHRVEWLGLLGVVPVLLLVAINGVAVSILLGMICARFRDVAPIVASVVQVVFFVTPIVWPPQALGPNAWWVVLNPLYTPIDLIRSPLMGMPESPHSWSILIGVTLCNWAVSFIFFSRFRARVAFWV